MLYGQSRKHFYRELDSIRQQFQAEWKRIPSEAKQRELDEIAIAFTYNTNAIEGSTITLPEAREILHRHIAPNKSLSDVREAESHYTAFKEMLKEDSIDQETLLAWHNTLFKETKPGIAGNYRDYGVRVSSYKAIDWQDIKQEMSKLIRFTLEKMHPVELAARVHYRFEKIHPFGDGNGRVGRLFMNALLWRKHYPMLIIEYRKRKAYYRALSQDEERFVQYFLRTYIAAHASRYKK